MKPARDFEITPWGSGTWSVAPKDISIYSPDTGGEHCRSAAFFRGSVCSDKRSRRDRLVGAATAALLVLSVILFAAILRQLG